MSEIWLYLIVLQYFQGSFLFEILQLRWLGMDILGSAYLDLPPDSFITNTFKFLKPWFPYL